MEFETYEGNASALESVPYRVKRLRKAIVAYSLSTLWTRPLRISASGVNRCAILPKTMVTADQPEIRRFDYARERAVGVLRRFIANFKDSRIVRLFAVVGIYALPAFLFLRRFGVTDLDIWWHMATGRWILQHHAIPRTEPFIRMPLASHGSRIAGYAKCSWNICIVGSGFVGIVIYELIFHVILGIALFHLLRSLLPHFWRSVALTAVGLYVIDYMVSPRPSMLTIFLSIVMLDILLSVRRTGNAQKLWLLPAIFLLWSNWHIQMVYGLILLGAFATESLLNRIVFGNKACVPLRDQSRSGWRWRAVS